MLPDWVSNPGPLTYESGAIPIALRGPASISVDMAFYIRWPENMQFKGCFIDRYIIKVLFCHIYSLLRQSFFLPKQS